MSVLPLTLAGFLAPTAISGVKQTFSPGCAWVIDADGQPVALEKLAMQIADETAVPLTAEGERQSEIGASV